MKPKKALARGYRSYPQAVRVFSSNFPEPLLGWEGKCFVPVEDYKELEKRYIKLFKRYKRELQNNSR